MAGRAARFLWNLVARARQPGVRRTNDALERSNVMFLKIPTSREWDWGPGIVARLLEIDGSGFVRRYLDLDLHGQIVDFSPSDSNVYGITDHPPFSMTSDWKEVEISETDFENNWRKANERV